MNTIRSRFGNFFSTRKISMLVAAFFMVAAAPFLLAAPANAVGDCSGNAVCLYEHKEFGGGSNRVYIAGVPTCYNLSYLKNQVSSVVNNTINNVRYYNVANCNDNNCYLQDGSLDYRRNLYYDYYTNCSPFRVNDDIESVRIY